MKPKYTIYPNCSMAFEGKDGNVYCKQSYTTIQNNLDTWKQYDRCSDIDKSNLYVSCLMKRINRRD